MRKIAILLPSRLPVPAVMSGGIEQLTEGIINENEKNPIAFFHIISMYDKNAKKLQANYLYTKFHNIKLTLLNRILNKIQRKLYLLLLKKQYPNTNEILIARSLKNLTIDKIVVYGNIDHLPLVSRIVKKEAIIYYQATLSFDNINNLLLAGKVIVGSTHSRNALVSLLPNLKDKLKLIRSGIDIRRFDHRMLSSRREIVRNKYQLSSDVPILCYVGRLSKDKGVLELLQAAIKLKDTEKFKLFVIGSFGVSFGAKKNERKIDMFNFEIKKLVHNLGESCIMTGFVSDEELIDYLASTDVGVVPSIGEDVSPLTYFQYQALGIPTIVSDAGGIPEFYSPDYSIMVKRGERMVEDLAVAIRKLLFDRDLRNQMSKASLKKRHELSLERFFNETVKLFLED